MSNKELIQLIKEVPGACWSQTKRKWHFSVSKQVVEMLKEKVAAMAALDISLLKTQWEDKTERAKEKKTDMFPIQISSGRCCALITSNGNQRSIYLNGNTKANILNVICHIR